MYYIYTPLTFSFLTLKIDSKYFRTETLGFPLMQVEMFQHTLNMTRKKATKRQRI